MQSLRKFLWDLSPPRAGEVQIEVNTVSINPIDLMMTQGYGRELIKMVTKTSKEIGEMKEKMSDMDPTK